MRRAALLALGSVLSVSCSSVQSTPPVASPSNAALAAAHSFDRDIAPLLANYCTGCHSGADAPAEVRLDFASEDDARRRALEDEDFWTRVSRNVTSGQMPPPYASNKPSDSERQVLADWISGNVLTANGMPDPGPFMVRRLNNREYANTVRDLLYLPADYNAAEGFPADERGDGFDNNAATLTISPLLIERYLDAAEDATVIALGLNSLDRDSILSTPLIEPSKYQPIDYANWRFQSRANLEVALARAYRRPVSEAEIDQLMEMADLGIQHNAGSINAATGLALRAALLSPDFLFRIERDPNPDGTGKVFEITEYQLASRLSYFLWSTMPDDSLFAAARDGTLRSDLDRHIERMLQDPKAISLTRDFMGQWLEIRGLHEVQNVDPALLEAMMGETEHFFDYIVKEDRSILDFLDADYTFLNEALAKHYGIEGVTGEEFRRVQVDRSRRGGIFTQASFLTLTSKPLGSGMRTSPVVRGKWILENIFNETIPPPPPDVPSLDIQEGELKGTVRQIFEQHRADPVCAGCHARMDPYGFALENYDGTGRWRDQDSGIDVDASGEINGRSFVTPTEFRALLASREDDFRRAVVRKMLSYALGRGIEASDRATIESIAEGMKAEGDRFSTLIELIVKSYPFQHARGTPTPVGSGETLADEIITGDQVVALGVEDMKVYHPIFVPPEGVEADAANASSVAPPNPNGPRRPNGGAPGLPPGTAPNGAAPRPPGAPGGVPGTP